MSMHDEHQLLMTTSCKVVSVSPSQRPGVSPRLRQWFLTPFLLGWLFSAVAAFAAFLAFGTPQANADTMDEFKIRKRNAWVAYGGGNIDRAERVKRINDAWADYINQQQGAFIPIVGGAAYASNFPVSDVVPIGQTADLTFHWIDTASRQFTMGPEIARVDYFVSTDASIYDFFGSSSDAAFDFALPFTQNAVDSDVLAVPFDFQNNEIFIAGLDNQNVAPGYVTTVSPVPEPASVVLLTLGLLGVVARCGWKPRLKSEYAPTA